MPSLETVCLLLFHFLAMEQEEDTGPEVQNLRSPVKSQPENSQCGRFWTRRKLPLQQLLEVGCLREWRVGLSSLSRTEPLPLFLKVTLVSSCFLLGSLLAFEVGPFSWGTSVAASQGLLFLNQKIRCIKQQ